MTTLAGFAHFSHLKTADLVDLFNQGVELLGSDDVKKVSRFSDRRAAERRLGKLANELPEYSLTPMGWINELGEGTEQGLGDPEPVQPSRGIQAQEVLPPVAAPAPAPHTARHAADADGEIVEIDEPVVPKLVTNRDHAMALSTLEREFPALFRQHGCPGKTSDKYVPIPTNVIVERLMENDYGIHSVQTSALRAGSEARRGYQPHMLRMRHNSIEPINGVTPEVIVINSYDASKSYRLLAGLFRFACENGMIIGETVAGLRIKHQHTTLEEVLAATDKVIADATGHMRVVSEWSGIKVPERDQYALAKQLFDRRFIHNKSLNGGDAGFLLEAHRDEDEGDDLWRVFNRMQENTIKGGNTYNTGRKSKIGEPIYGTTREVKKIDDTVIYNRLAWDLCAEYAAAA